MARLSLPPLSVIPISILFCLVCRADYDPAIDKDCLRLRTDALSVEFVRGEWKIVDSNSWVFSFGTKEQYARRALEVIHEYRFDAVCFVGRPQPPIVYLLTSGKVPSFPISGEQCKKFDPTQLTLSLGEAGWRIKSETETLFNFGQKEDEAARALRVLRHHQFRYSCMLESSLSFRYLRQ